MMSSLNLLSLLLILNFGHYSFAITAMEVKENHQLIALIQYNADAHFNQSEHNINKLTEFAATAVANGSKIIVFPEGSTYGYADKQHRWCSDLYLDDRCVDVAQVAEVIPGGRSSNYWSAFSKKYGVYVIFNVPEIDEGTYFNTAGIAKPDGTVDKYRKRDLYYLDKYYASPGDSPFVLETSFGKFGILICKDATYPGLLEDYGALGITSVILTMDWDANDPYGPYAARTWFQRRACTSGINIYASDQSTWDGTGFYSAEGDSRQRDGLPAVAPGIDGISFHAFASSPF